jgi:hypothetical protein
MVECSDYTINYDFSKRKYTDIMEYNYLINPSHPDFMKLKVEPPQPFELDPRLWKS